MDVIFLDVDGVLISGHWIKTTRKDRTFDPEAVKLLDAIIDEADVDLVISSCWRIGRSTAELKQLMQDQGLKNYNRVIGRTPSGGNMNGHRGREISEWIEANDVDNFVIIDDDSDMNPHMDRLVKTTFECGLKEEHAERVLELLKKHNQTL